MPTNEDEKEIIPHTKHGWRTFAQCNSCVKSGLLSTCAKPRVTCGGDDVCVWVRAFGHHHLSHCVQWKGQTDGRKDVDFTLNENRVKCHPTCITMCAQRRTSWRSSVHFEFCPDQLFPKWIPFFYFNNTFRTPVNTKQFWALLILPLPTLNCYHEI